MLIQHSYAQLKRIRLFASVHETKSILKYTTHAQRKTSSGFCTTSLLPSPPSHIVYVSVCERNGCACVPTRHRWVTRCAHTSSPNRESKAKHRATKNINTEHRHEIASRSFDGRKLVKLRWHTRIFVIHVL